MVNQGTISCLNTHKPNIDRLISFSWQVRFKSIVGNS